MDFNAFATQYVETFHGAMERMDKKPFSALCEAMLDAYENEKTIFILGNGGSAATASRFRVSASSMRTKRMRAS